MYGLLLEGIYYYLRTIFGDEMLNEIRRKANISHTNFSTHKVSISMCGIQHKYIVIKQVHDLGRASEIYIYQIKLSGFILSFNMERATISRVQQKL